MGKSKVATTTTPSSGKAVIDNKKAIAASSSTTAPLKENINDHLPPIFLVFTVMVCSGFLFMYSFRDVFATGRTIGGYRDHAYLSFTNSLLFFNNEKGWKSTQGGLSAIMPITTDANNMGGLFVRKIGGAACLVVQLQKLWPIVFHPIDARWRRGHFNPLFATAIVSNLILAAFYGMYIVDDLQAAGADELPKLFVVALLVETVVMLYYLLSQKGTMTKGPAIALTEGKTHTSVVSRIVARTNFLVCTFVLLIAGRDLFLPGHILTFIPRDDIYLEWTGALIHSPPEDSPEAVEHGMEQAFFVGDKYMSQFMALNMLILCLYKFVAAFGIRYRSDGGGLVQARMIWKAQAVGGALIVYLFRLFANAASSASLDLRWHLMSLAYETFILGLYGFF
ncbi:hypothetical protein IV203_006494 [Nitzschia inconspicua]|uniref:Uncharacterized protein n=1 Tax=Nitzschia inconspicua TaxID=303405 RepID=A0A9K3PAM9_9STRA|nr:hypothetical protein IV203_006639 [Nitzschia inconspicua]KAG7340090.1 hypothetical protein IV203_006494 [Nitzschia inconspicua]